MDPYESNSFEDSVDQSGAGPQEESPASSPAPEPLIRKIPGRYSEILASVRASAAATDSTKVEQEAIEGFKAIMAARQAARTARNPTYAVIPPFFFRKVSELVMTVSILRPCVLSAEAGHG